MKIKQVVIARITPLNICMVLPFSIAVKIIAPVNKQSVSDYNQSGLDAKANVSYSYTCIDLGCADRQKC